MGFGTDLCFQFYCRSPIQKRNADVAERVVQYMIVPIFFTPVSPYPEGLFLEAVWCVYVIKILSRV